MHRKVQVWIYHYKEGEPEPHLLLLKTKPDRGEYWQPVTGSVEGEETLLAAARREAFEETGFQGDMSALPGDYTFKDRWGREVQEYPFALQIVLAHPGVPRAKLDPTEHVDSGWFTPSEARSRLVFPTNEQGLNLLLQLLVTKGQEFYGRH